MFSQCLRPSGGPACAPGQLCGWEVGLHSICTRDMPVGRSRDREIVWPAVPGRSVAWLGGALPRWRAGELHATLALDLSACQLVE